MTNTNKIKNYFMVIRFKNRDVTRATWKTMNEEIGSDRTEYVNGFSFNS